ncbi:MAG: 3-hydroxyacyl-CoA dehydrogenase NAD-binding domain-containing protein [Gammaproteobacteria bacterium]|jgi:3-hydroxyacyl-CoA dehydrogenase/enoyl-CoA hydratase/3-hydroxybutyryl-CoA epimerase
MENKKENVHFRVETDNDNIVWLHFDKADTGTNVLNTEVFEQLDQQLQQIAAQGPRGLVILSDKANGFIAGADISAFTQVKTSDQTLAFLRRGQDVFNRLEALPFPTVALIHGFCLGGGTELSLACRYRITRDDPGTRVGLPEVKLGIHPGWGGSARMVPLLGGLKAMDLILSGRSIDGRTGKRMGLVDMVVPERHLRAAARKLVMESPTPHQPGWLDRLSNNVLVRPLLARIFSQQVAKRAPRTHYPSPYAMIDIWRQHATDKSRMLDAEVQSLAQLITGATAQNLVRVFFLQEQLKSLGKDKSYQPKYVHVIGAGTMGGDIAAWCALRGFHVSLQDQSPQRIAPAIQRAHTLFKRKLKQPIKINEAMDRLLPDHKGMGVERADIVIEAIFEDTDVKRSLYKTIEPRMKPDAVLATNTSSIPLEELCSALSRPERLVGLHFFNPVAMMQLVEVVKGESTSAEVAAHAMTFTRQIDRLPLPVTSTPGFLVNRILMPYLMEAVLLEAEGIPPAVIDKAATAFGMPMGPVQLADTVGLDICLHVAEILAEHFAAEIPESLRKRVADGNLGRKSGRGFYNYKKGKPLKTKAGTGNWNMEEISNRLIDRLLNEAVSCLREHVVESSDLLDAGMIFGTGFAPFRGGPMHHIEAVGAETIYKQLQSLKALRGERFAPDAGWGALTQS